MGEPFTKRRMGHIFRPTGRSLVVALDHGTGLDVYPCLRDTRKVLEAVVEAGADAVLTTPGILAHFGASLQGVGVILRADFCGSQLAGEAPAYRLSFSAEDALRMGADAVACMGFPGSPWEAATLGNVAELAGQCHRWAVPLMAEMVPGGFADPSRHTAENLRLAARIGAELGADFIKTKFVGPTVAFREVTQHCYCPVLVLGGERAADGRRLFTAVRDALEAGARGVVIGRNVWAHPRPGLVIRALVQLIHQGASVEEALDTLGGE
jgi:fructose-bisphosphate aldolase, class I